KCADLRSVLFEFGSIVEKAFYAAGRKEANDIVFALIENGGDVVADRTIHKRSGETTIIMLQPIDNFVILLVLGTGIEKFLVLFMFVDHIEHALVQPIRSIKNLTFSVEDEFLKIKRHGFG